MIRNPWSSSYYKGPWNSKDPRWTDEVIKQVPKGVDPRSSDSDGVFFVDYQDFSDLFSFISVGFTNSSYTTSWFDVEDDQGDEHSFFFDVGSEGSDLFVSVESYFLKQFPTQCF
jgi:hypothetical protein